MIFTPDRVEVYGGLPLRHCARCGGKFAVDDGRARLCPDCRPEKAPEDVVEHMQRPMGERLAS